MAIKYFDIAKSIPKLNLTQLQELKDALFATYEETSTAYDTFKDELLRGQIVDGSATTYLKFVDFHNEFDKLHTLFDVLATSIVAKFFVEMLQENVVSDTKKMSYTQKDRENISKERAADIFIIKNLCKQDAADARTYMFQNRVVI